MRPFRIDIPDSQIAELRDRIASTRWPASAPVSGWERGVPQDYLRTLADYWQDHFDWRQVEQQLNQHPQYITEIDGVNVHFLHIRSAEPHARPLLLTHGWPGSIVEYLDVIGPLTDPRAHGADPANAFHLVIPSLPGHGFSGPNTELGWDIRRIAGALAELMHQLGYDSYLTAGEDWGSIIGLELCHVDPEHLAGAYVAWPTVPAGDAVELSQMSEEDLQKLNEVSATWFDSELSGYLRLQTTRPSTVSYGLSDSPVGQLAWIVEKFREWNKMSETPEDAVDRDRLLANVSLYWFTGTMASTLQLYFESAASLGGLFAPGVPHEPINVPVGIAFFQQDPAPPLRLFAELEASPITHWSTFAKGGHFSCLEQPTEYVEDVRAFAALLSGQKDSR